jgi:hypothetical protein
MPPASESRLLRCATRIYRLMLRGYPLTFRREYSREMALAFADRARDVVRSQGDWALVSFMLRVAWDWLVTVIQERNDMHRVNSHRSQPSVSIIVGEWMMVLPAALLFGLMAVRSTGGQGLPARVALLFSNWAASHMSRAWSSVVFIGLPAIVVLAGGATLLRIWREDRVVRQDAVAALGLLRRHLVVLLLASATVLATTILIPVLAHAITD